MARAKRTERYEQLHGQPCLHIIPFVEQKGSEA